MLVPRRRKAIRHPDPRDRLFGRGGRRRHPSETFGGPVADRGDFVNSTSRVDRISPPSSAARRPPSTVSEPPWVSIKQALIRITDYSLEQLSASVAVVATY
jgi:hypothetical protein